MEAPTRNRSDSDRCHFRAGAGVGRGKTGRLMMMMEDDHVFFLVVVVMLLDLGRTWRGCVGESRLHSYSRFRPRMFLVNAFPKIRGSSNGGVARYKISSRKGQGLPSSSTRWEQG